jgi:hypothetical protein
MCLKLSSRDYGLGYNVRDSRGSEKLVNDRLEKICEEAIITKSRYLLGINWEELRKTTEICSQIASAPVKTGTRHHPDTNQKLHRWRVSGLFIILCLAFANLLSDESNIVMFLFSFIHASNWRD